MIFTLASSPATSRTSWPACSASIASSVPDAPARPASIAAASTSRRKACGVCARNSISRGSVPMTRVSPGATCFTVSCTGTAGTTAPLAMAPSMARSITAAVTKGRAASCTRITDACAETAAKPSATESCRRAPPVTMRRGVVVAGTGASVVPGGTTIDDLGHARVGVEGGDGSLEQGAPADRQPLLGDAGAEPRPLAAGCDDH